MKKLILMVELEYDEESTHDGDRDPEAKRWFLENVLGASPDSEGALFLHSNEIGDEIGSVRVLAIIHENVPYTLAGHAKL